MDKKYELILERKHPILQPKQNKNIIKNIIEQNMEIWNPSIYEKEIQPITDLLVFGLMCGNGWFNLIDALCSQIENNKNIVVEEVKEKFGTLRFYVYGSTEKEDEIISRAESLSSKICESCGKLVENGQLEQTGWIYTRCNRCLSQPQKAFSLSKKAISTDIIKKYLSDENIFYTKIKDIKLNKPFLNIRGTPVIENDKLFVTDDTGKLEIDDAFIIKDESITTAYIIILNNCELNKEKTKITQVYSYNLIRKH